MITIPFKIRCGIIFQLCLGFYAFLSFFSYPFMNRHFELKSELLFLESIRGDLTTVSQLDPLKASSMREIADAKKLLFDSLDKKEKTLINSRVEKAKRDLEHSLVETFNDYKTLFTIISPFEFAWIVIAIFLPIFLLLKKDWAYRAIWIFPILTLAFVLNNVSLGLDPYQIRDWHLFPNESDLLKRYPELTLPNAWNHYLVENWAKETPDKEATQFASQLILGEFLFTKERIKHFTEFGQAYYERMPVLTLVLYLSWNTIFAFCIWLTWKNKLT